MQTGAIMKKVSVYKSAEGWIYEVWIASRAIVIGRCFTREAAEAEAALV